MTTEKKEADKKPIELEDEQIEQVAGGRKRQAGIVEDPCAGGEVVKKY